MKIKHTGTTAVVNYLGTWQPGEIREIPLLVMDLGPSFEIVGPVPAKPSRAKMKRWERRETKPRLDDKFERDNEETREGGGA